MPVCRSRPIDGRTESTGGRRSDQVVIDGNVLLTHPDRKDGGVGGGGEILDNSDERVDAYMGSDDDHDDAHMGGGHDHDEDDHDDNSNNLFCGDPFHTRKDDANGPDDDGEDGVEGAEVCV